MVKTKAMIVYDPIRVSHKSTNHTEPLPPHEACWIGICSFFDKMGKKIGKLFQNKRKEEEKRKALLERRKTEAANEKLRHNLSDEIAERMKLEQEKEVMCTTLSNQRLYNHQKEETHKHQLQGGKEGLERLLNDYAERRAEDRAFLLDIFDKHELLNKKFESLHSQYRELAISYQALAAEYRTLEQTNQEAFLRMRDLENKNDELLRNRCTHVVRYANTAHEEEQIREKGLQNAIDVLQNFKCSASVEKFPSAV